MMFSITVEYPADLCYARKSGILCIRDRLEHFKGSHYHTETIVRDLPSIV